MQTYKIIANVQQHRPIKIKFLSARQTYFTTYCEVFTQPESKQK